MHDLEIAPDPYVVSKCFSTLNIIPMKISYSCHVIVPQDILQYYPNGISMHLCNERHCFKIDGMSAMRNDLLMYQMTVNNQHAMLSSLREDICNLKNDLALKCEEIEKLRAELEDEKELKDTVAQIARCAKAKTSIYEKEVRRLSLKLQEFVAMDFVCIPPSSPISVLQYDMSDSKLPSDLL